MSIPCATCAKWSKHGNFSCFGVEGTKTETVACSTRDAVRLETMSLIHVTGVRLGTTSVALDCKQGSI